MLCSSMRVVSESSTTRTGRPRLHARGAAAARAPGARRRPALGVEDELRVSLGVERRARRQGIDACGRGSGRSTMLDGPQEAIDADAADRAPACDDAPQTRSAAARAARRRRTLASGRNGMTAPSYTIESRSAERAMSPAPRRSVRCTASSGTAASSRRPRPRAPRATRRDAGPTARRVVPRPGSLASFTSPLSSRDGLAHDVEPDAAPRDLRDRGRSWSRHSRARASTPGRAAVPAASASRRHSSATPRARPPRRRPRGRRRCRRKRPDGRAG